MKIRKGTKVFTIKTITSSDGEVKIPKGSFGILNHYNPKLNNYHIIFENKDVESLNQGEFRILNQNNFITSIEIWMDLEIQMGGYID